MNIQAVAYIGAFLQALPQLITATEEVASWLTTESAKIQAMVAAGKNPTAEDWAALDAAIVALRAQLDAGSSSSTEIAGSLTPSTSSPSSSPPPSTGDAATAAGQANAGEAANPSTDAAAGALARGAASAPTPFPSVGANEGA